MTIVWREAMSVSNALIDTDHRYLMCLINTVELALHTAQPADILRTVIEQLREYTQQHFEREERIMVAVSFSRYDHHRGQHQQLIRDLNEAAKPVLEAADGAVPVGARDAMIALLRHWLVDHIFKEDMNFKPILARYPATFCP